MTQKLLRKLIQRTREIRESGVGEVSLNGPQQKRVFFLAH